MIDKVLFIVNPASAGGRTASVWPALRSPIEARTGPFDERFTERSGHATELAEQAAREGRRRIIAVGGDGTISEVAAGVLKSESRGAAIGLVHQGTGGDFRRALGIEHRLDRYLEPIAKNAPRPIDAAEATFTDRDGRRVTRPFINVASFGMGGLVDKYVEEGTRTTGGSTTYLLSALKALATGGVGQIELRMQAEGRTTIERFETRMIAVCNGGFFGGGMNIAPAASLADGMLDIIAIKGRGRGPVLSAMAGIYTGTHTRQRDVHHWRASKVEIRLLNAVGEGDRFLLDLDGEWAGSGPLTFRAIPKALNVLA